MRQRLLTASQQGSSQPQTQRSGGQQGGQGGGAPQQQQRQNQPPAQSQQQQRPNQPSGQQQQQQWPAVGGRGRGKPQQQQQQAQSDRPQNQGRGRGQPQAVAPAPQQQWRPQPQQQQQQQVRQPQQQAQQQSRPAQQQQQQQPRPQQAWQDRPQGQDRNRQQGGLHRADSVQSVQSVQSTHSGKSSASGGRSSASGGKPPQKQDKQDERIPAALLKDLKLLSIVPYKGHGTSGRKLPDIETNYLRINMKGQAKAYHYDVRIEPERPKKLLTRVFLRFVAINFPRETIAFDGMNSAYSARVLDIPENIQREVTIIHPETHAERRYTVAIKPANDSEIPIGQLLSSYRNTPQRDDAPNMKRALQAFEVILKVSEIK